MNKHPKRVWYHILPDSNGWIESYWSDSPKSDAAGGKVMEYLNATEYHEDLSFARIQARYEAFKEVVEAWHTDNLGIESFEDWIEDEFTKAAILMKE